jgi:hypothetical protein
MKLIKKAAVIVCRDDNYGGNLHHRARLCIDSLLTVFDKIYYVDWKCVNGVSLLESANIKNDNIIEVKLTKDLIHKHYPDLVKYPIIESIGRNVGIRKAVEDGIDWICSTNIDVLIGDINFNTLDNDTLYTARRRDIPENVHLDKNFDIKKVFCDLNSYEQKPLSTVNGVAVWDREDIWSLVVCCGDFQLAHKDMWTSIRGFEEEAYGRAFADSNLMKRPILIGKKTDVLDINIFHLNHGSSGNVLQEDEQKLPLNDFHRYVVNFNKSSNKGSWGMFGFEGI